MIVCPNCNHPNPDGAVQCEACYTPLPATISCPNCSATVQADATFCGQCGYNLRTPAETTASATVAPDIPLPMPDLVTPDPLVQPEPVGMSNSNSVSGNFNQPQPAPVPPTAVASGTSGASSPPASTTPPPTIATKPVSPPPAAPTSKTQLQQQTARLIHVQTDRTIELSPSLSVIHIGKPNDRIPPDVDVSGFPSSEIVSRIHADIRAEGDAYYIEDVGSSNGTYINNLPLLPGNRHRLRPGDRISLGKGDLVTFLFQFS
ncbi:MAG: FHA domain-containing protein [Nostocaceae cyanobacterium]|nr:FHA domain-containing protein [Nostocaceae cyanobacterium]